MDNAREAFAINILYGGAKLDRNLVKVTNHFYDLESKGVYIIDMEWCDFNMDEYISKQLSTATSKNLHEASGLSHPKGDWNNWDVMEQVSGGVEFIHDRNLVHRDLKPRNSMAMITVANLIVLFSQRDGCWKITDFGLTTKGTSSEAEPCPDGYGSPGYRAPEVIRQLSFTNTVDIWALGCILFELATKGKKAFKSDSYVLEYSAASAPPLESVLTLTDLDEDLCDMLKRMLKIAGSERPPAITLRRDFAINSWRDIGDRLRKEGNLDGSIKAYQKGLTRHRTCGPLWERLGEAKEQHFQSQVHSLKLHSSLGISC